MDNLIRNLRKKNHKLGIFFLSVKLYCLIKSFDNMGVWKLQVANIFDFTYIYGVYYNVLHIHMFKFHSV